MKFNLNEEKIENLGASYTINEIYQQPESWKKVIKLILDNKKNIKDFFNLFANKKIKYIFTGSGTSEFIGNVLSEHFLINNMEVISIAATDIVSNPNEYFKQNQPTVVISFARSGNSPESVGVVNFAKAIIQEFYQIIITCNKDGALYQQFKDDNKTLILLMPEETNDQSFAMTSSYTSMLISALLTLSESNFKLLRDIENVINNVQDLLDNKYQNINEIANINHQRIVFLGSNILKGYAQESALKVLELSSGKIISAFNSPMGFRHGPKSIINHETVIFIYLSSNKYTRKYDFDLLKEVFHDNIAKTIVVFDNLNNEVIKKYCHYYFVTSQNKITNEVILGLQYVILSQMYALFKSIFLQNTPDNPCSTGEVNRVVKGVKIYLTE